MTVAVPADEGTVLRPLTRALPGQVAERPALSATRRAHAADLGALLGELLGAFRQAGDGVPGIDGCPYVTYYAEDSDGPVQLVRPMARLSAAQAVADRMTDVQARTEAAHEEIFVRLTMAQMSDPHALATGGSAFEALRAYAASNSLVMAQPPRQVLIADWRTVAPDEAACDLAIPVRDA